MKESEPSGKSRKLEAEQLGGEDEKERPDNECIGCDKPQHVLRSIYWQPNHLKNQYVKSVVQITNATNIRAASKNIP